MKKSWWARYKIKIGWLCKCGGKWIDDGGGYGKHKCEKCGRKKRTI